MHSTEIKIPAGSECLIQAVTDGQACHCFRSERLIEGCFLTGKGMGYELSVISYRL